MKGSIRFLALLSCIVALLLGCSTTPHNVVWYAPDKSPQQANKDLAESELEASHLTSVWADLGGLMERSRAEARRQDYIQKAMRGRGYELVNPASVTNGTAYPKP